MSPYRLVLRDVSKAGGWWDEECKGMLTGYNLLSKLYCSAVPYMMSITKGFDAVKGR